MKTAGILVIVFIAAIAVWFSILFWAPNLSTIVLVRTGHCPSGDIATQSCRELLSALGATGDIFGAVTSLFSGLALFAVALTLWADSNAKRVARKPLVVTYLDDDSITLDAPRTGPEPELTMSVTAKVANQTGEPALNVRVNSEIIAGGLNRAATPFHLRLPLLSGGTEDAAFKLRLGGQHLQSLLAALTQDDAHAQLKMTTEYASLEGIEWATSAVYELRCKLGERRRRLNAFRSGTDDFAELWENNAAVPLHVDVQDRSWRHEKR